MRTNFRQVVDSIRFRAGETASKSLATRQSRAGGVMRQFEHFPNLVTMFFTRAAEKGDAIARLKSDASKRSR